MSVASRLPFDRWTLLVLAISFVALAAVVSADSLMHASILGFYLLPVALPAWLTRGYWWVVLVICATAGWHIAAWVSQYPVISSPGQYLWETGMRLLIFGVVAWLVARLQYYTRTPSMMTPSYDTSGLLSANGLIEAVERPDLSADRAAVLIIDLERKVTAYQGRALEHTALVAAMMARVLTRHTRPNDVRGRPGGTQFIIIMPNTGEAAARAVTEAICEELPGMRKVLDESFVATTLLLWTDVPASAATLRREAEVRLAARKSIEPGSFTVERYAPTAA